MTTRRASVRAALVGVAGATLLASAAGAAAPGATAVLAPGASSPAAAVVATPAATTLAPAWLREVLPEARFGGSGRFRYFGFHVYDARLWVTPAGYRAAGRGAPRTPFALELRYGRDFKGADIARSSRDEMQELGHGSAIELEQWQASMARLFPDVRAGERLTGVYRPGVGALFFHDGKPLGQVADARFAHAFFAIWFDPRSRKADLRAQLLADTASAERP